MCSHVSNNKFDPKPWNKTVKLNQGICQLALFDRGAHTHHCHDGLDGVGRGLFAAGLLDEAGAEVLDVEGHSLYHGFAHGGPVFGQLWKGKYRANRLSVYRINGSIHILVKEIIRYSS